MEHGERSGTDGPASGLDALAVVALWMGCMRSDPSEVRVLGQLLTRPDALAFDEQHKCLEDDERTLQIFFLDLCVQGRECFIDEVEDAVCPEVCVSDVRSRNERTETSALGIFRDTEARRAARRSTDHCRCTYRKSPGTCSALCRGSLWPALFLRWS